MSLSVILRPEAEEDLEAGRNWYERKRAGLGDKLIAQVDRVLERISALPMLYPVLSNNVRAGRTRQFSFVIYYRVFTSHIEVLAILHGSRDPSVWRSRV